mgnify:CR=1 FL=1
METLKNKLCAVGLLVCGGLSAYVGSDGTAMALLGTIAVPLFFAKENWITEGWARTRALSFSVCAHFAGSITENDAR